MTRQLPFRSVSNFRRSLRRPAGLIDGKGRIMGPPSIRGRFAAGRGLEFFSGGTGLS